MARWIHTVGFKEMIPDDLDSWDHVGLQLALNNIADKLKADPYFAGFSFDQFYRLPEGDDFFSPGDYADRLLERLYDFCDRQRIWLKPI